jgi:hypothetical protein
VKRISALNSTLRFTLPSSWLQILVDAGVAQQAAQRAPPLVHVRHDAVERGRGSD